MLHPVRKRTLVSLVSKGHTLKGIIMIVRDGGRKAGRLTWSHDEFTSELREVPLLANKWCVHECPLCKKCCELVPRSSRSLYRPLRRKNHKRRNRAYPCAPQRVLQNTFRQVTSPLFSCWCTSKRLNVHPKPVKHFSRRVCVYLVGRESGQFWHKLWTSTHDWTKEESYQSIFQWVANPRILSR